MLMHKDRPAYHALNLGYAAAIETARRDILNVLCAHPAALKVLTQMYAHVRRENRSLDEKIHSFVDRFADDRGIAESVIRERANGISLKCDELVEFLTEAPSGQKNNFIAKAAYRRNAGRAHPR